MSELADALGLPADFDVSAGIGGLGYGTDGWNAPPAVSYTHLRAHET